MRRNDERTEMKKKKKKHYGMDNNDMRHGFCFLFVPAPWSNKLQINRQKEYVSSFFQTTTAHCYCLSYKPITKTNYVTSNK